MSLEISFDNWPGEPYLEFFALGGRLQQKLRYGENPHQTAAFYSSLEFRPGVSTSDQVQGKGLSYNNLNDTDAAFELVAEFDEPACAIIKHANPSGVAVADTQEAAFRNALACDPVSAFGGIIALNRTLEAFGTSENSQPDCWRETNKPERSSAAVSFGRDDRQPDISPS